VPAELISATAEVEFKVTGEPRMRSFLGPDALMEPYAVKVQFVGGEVSQVLVYGWCVLASGKVGKTPHVRRFEHNEIDQEPAWIAETIDQADARVFSRED
jgi:hypothetical protein